MVEKHSYLHNTLNYNASHSDYKPVLQAYCYNLSSELDSALVTYSDCYESPVLQALQACKVCLNLTIRSLIGTT